MNSLATNDLAKESLEGFDARWTSPEDYILGITKEIWEDRGIATLRRSYAPDVIVRTPLATTIGCDNVIAATMATLAEMPDRQLLGEDVVWSHDPDGGFLSSHRLLSTATYADQGFYGAAEAPTSLLYRILADCACRADQIYDEWLIRDHAAILRQLGKAPKAFAAELIAREGGPDKASTPLTPDNETAHVYKGLGDDHEVGARHAAILGAIMAADLAVIPREYDRACALAYSSGRDGVGWNDADRFWCALRSAFPSAHFAIHHQIGRDDPDMPPRSAVRWSLTGKHDGGGAFGPATGAPVHVMGISHAEFGPWGLRREWTLIDEVAIWKQILLHQGGA